MKLFSVLLYMIVLVLRVDSIDVLQPFRGFRFGIGERGFGFPFRPFFLNRVIPSPERNQCEDPCKTLERTCEKRGSQCRLIQVPCYVPPCSPIAQCVRSSSRVDSFNPCRYNKPILMTSKREYTNCFYPGVGCPAHSKCVLYDRQSRCCYTPLGCRADAGPSKTAPVSPAASHRFCPAANQVTCRRQNCVQDRDCPFGSFCCRTRCGTKSCTRPRRRRYDNINAMFRDVRHGIPINPIVSVSKKQAIRLPFSDLAPGTALGLPGLQSVDRGVCPSMMSIKTCHPDMCQSDIDCYQGKCCISRCGRRVCTAGKGRISFFG